MRLYAEDPVDFLPRSGSLEEWIEPAGPGVRVDSGFERGSVVGVEYDPLLAKLVVHAADRPAAIERALRALSEWVVLGVETNRPLLEAALSSAEFRSGDYATDLLARLPRRESGAPSDAAWIAAALSFAAKAAGTAAVAGPADPWGAANGWRS